MFNIVRYFRERKRKKLEEKFRLQLFDAQSLEKFNEQEKVRQQEIWNRDSKYRDEYSAKIEIATKIFESWKIPSENEKCRIRMFSRKHTELDTICFLSNLECSNILERHHQDYSKPLEIVTLCDHHHRLAHANIFALDLIIDIERKLGHL